MGAKQPGGGKWPEADRQLRGQQQKAGRRAGSSPHSITSSARARLRRHGEPERLHGHGIDRQTRTWSAAVPAGRRALLLARFCQHTRRRRRQLSPPEDPGRSSSGCRRATRVLETCDGKLLRARSARTQGAPGFVLITGRVGCGMLDQAQQPSPRVDTSQGRRRCQAALSVRATRDERGPEPLRDRLDGLASWSA